MNGVVVLLIALVAQAGMIIPAHAQAPAGPSPIPDGPRYVVTYLEVMPTAIADGKSLVRLFRAATSKEAGNLRTEALQRIGLPHQFVLLEVWKDQAAADAHAKAAMTAQFHEKIKVIQNAPLDERVHFALSVGPIAASSARTAIGVVTHVDVIPPRREDGTALTKQLAEDGRKEVGNLRFDAVIQTNRQNHFTLIELWRNRKAAEAHGMAAHTRTFRENLAPASGALYDERFYQALH